MRYKILYTHWYGPQIKVAVFDFKLGRIIEFTLDELEKNELEDDLKDYIATIRDKIDSRYYEYQDKPTK